MALTERALWALIDSELAAWRRAGHAPLLWWRDDDARQPSAALERLIDLSERSRTPVALAIIPDRDLTPLAKLVAGRPLISPIQHGCDHVDRGQADGRSAEFSSQAAPEDVAPRIEAAWRRLSTAMDAAPIYAPPWNVITPNVLTALARTSLRALSLYGADAPEVGGLAQLNAHIDIMRWRPARFRGEPAILSRLWKLLRARRRAGRWIEPIGLLTHHRDLDATAWTFLEDLLAGLAAPERRTAWRSASEAIAAEAPLQERP